MNSVSVLLLIAILLGSMMEKPHAEYNPCDCQGQRAACLTICVGYEGCEVCAKYFQDCITRCRRRRDFPSFLRTGTETVKQDDRQREFSSMEAKEGNLKRKWKMPYEDTTA